MMRHPHEFNEKGEPTDALLKAIERKDRDDKNGLANNVDSK